jgi:hypothetical protein
MGWQEAQYVDEDGVEGLKEWPKGVCRVYFGKNLMNTWKN